MSGNWNSIFNYQRKSFFEEKRSVSDAHLTGVIAILFQNTLFQARPA